MYFSIIIPVFNAEQTLIKCLDSILEQSFPDYEVIMIDDGSTDGSLSICEKYADQDNRFLTFHQENRGPSAARNLGLKKAKGDFICFVDSDDFVSADYLSEIYAETKKSGADMLFFGYNSIDQNDRITGSLLPPEGLCGAALPKELSECDMFGYTWMKCISKRIMEGLLFEEDMSLFEDEVLACQAAEKAVSIRVLPKPIYYYRDGGKNALTGKTHVDYCVLSDKVYFAWENLMNDEPDSNIFMERKANRYVERCKYYGFEHKVDTKYFFKSLAATEFFRIHTKWTALDRQIQHGNWLAVEIAKRIYNLKISLAARL